MLIHLQEAVNAIWTDDNTDILSRWIRYYSCFYSIISNSSDSPCREVKIAPQRRRAALQFLRDLRAPKRIFSRFVCILVTVQ